MYIARNNDNAQVATLNSAQAYWENTSVTEVMLAHTGKNGATYCIPFDGDTIAKLRKNDR